MGVCLGLFALCAGVIEEIHIVCLIYSGIYIGSRAAISGEEGWIQDFRGGRVADGVKGGLCLADVVELEAAPSCIPAIVYIIVWSSMG